MRKKQRALKKELLPPQKSIAEPSYDTSKDPVSKSLILNSIKMLYFFTYTQRKRLCDGYLGGDEHGKYTALSFTADELRSPDLYIILTSL